MVHKCTAFSVIDAKGMAVSSRSRHTIQCADSCGLLLTEWISQLVKGTETGLTVTCVAVTTVVHTGRTMEAGMLALPTNLNLGFARHANETFGANTVLKVACV